MKWEITETPTGNFSTKNDGVTLRDTIAIEVLNGLLSAHRGVPFPTIVRESYEIADMMLVERNKERKEVL